jgi:hypothetical protein
MLRNATSLLPYNGMKDVLVLGAGFSKAISSIFPTTDELGTRAAEKSSRPHIFKNADREFKHGNFEGWLSRIAEPQPHLSEKENSANYALFIEMKELIVEILSACEWSACTSAAPDWLFELLAILHFRQASVITFNYDNLVEIGVASMPLWRDGSAPQITTADILGDTPQAASATVAFDGGLPELSPTFRLRKLHGSLNWFAASDDSIGATLRRAPVLSTFLVPRQYAERQRERELPGREPFLVPPSTTKSAFYRNPIMREIWRGAFRDLRQANRISLLGYSLPSADLVFNGLLQEAFQTAGSSNEESFTLDVVNTCPEPVLERLGLIDEIYAEQAQVSKSIKEFVRDYAARSSSDCVQAMQYMNYERSQENRLFIPWGSGQTNAPYPTPPLRPISASEGVRESDGALVLTIETPGQTVIDGIKLSDIREQLATAKSIVLRPDNAHGKETSIIGAWSYPTDEHHIPQIVLAPGGPIEKI